MPNRAHWEDTEMPRVATKRTVVKSPLTLWWDTYNAALNALIPITKGYDDVERDVEAHNAAVRAATRAHGWTPSEADEDEAQPSAPSTYEPLEFE
jgi:hypothetical protein